MTRVQYFIVATLLAGFWQCTSQQGKSSQTPSEGMPAEVLVVASEKYLDPIQNLWASNANVFDTILPKAESVSAPKFENRYKYWYRDEKAFNSSDRQSPLICVINDAGAFSEDLDNFKPVQMQEYGKTAVHIYKDVWATPQTVIQIRQTDLNQLAGDLASNFKNELTTLLYKFETQQGLPGNLAANRYCDSISKLLIGKYGFGISFTPQFRLEFYNQEVVWLWQETNAFYRHLFVNIFSDSAKINSKEKAIQNRDSFTYKYLKNDEGTHTAVSRSNQFPVSWQTGLSINGMDVSVLRGWYQESGTFRRGTFARYYFHDAKNHRYIAFDGFLFAPDMEKISFYRLFDIIAASLNTK